MHRSGCLDDRPLLNRHAVCLEVGFDHFIDQVFYESVDLSAEFVFLHPLPHRQNLFLTRYPFANHVNRCESAYRRHFDQLILHRLIAEVVPLLVQMVALHGFERISQVATLGSAVVIVELDHLNQFFSGHHNIHLDLKSLPPGALF